MRLGELLKVNREKRKLTQSELAKKLHVTPQAVSKWEKGQAVPSIDNLLLLSDLYNISIDELIQGSPFFRKPFAVGKVFSAKKGLLFLLVWFFICLFLTGFGYQPLGVFLGLYVLGCVAVFPVVFNDYWVIRNDHLEVVRYSGHVFRKMKELFFRRGAVRKIRYEEIGKVGIVYRKKARLSAFDTSPDVFYLEVTVGAEKLRLDFDGPAKAFLPQFYSFLHRRNVAAEDSLGIIRKLSADAPDLGEP